ncbi:hypothetical protein PV08_07206 [Exophiala spinifera]|uniref:Transcription factor domain-containing protein n=1 Tax=Exophiala spinifera TaxID=91928 RepID=A0A0D2B6C3_9EURO|nr:uncharacterized protein PV08_07206 [Exophiala spinifera]KIW14423.1 hypothetical protein PV08_07206 [Exophiala spinifera]
MLLEFDGLKDIALACGAAHLHTATGNMQLQEAGFAYYSRATSQVSRALSNIDWSRDQYNDAVSMTVTFLYIHGLFDMGTNKDVPKHVNGAIQLMNVRCRNSHSSPLARPIHRILWESILYQMFRQTVRHPFTIDFQPDLDFATKAESILRSLAFPDASLADNSPVIGFPLKLQKLMLEIVQLCKTLSRPEDHVLRRLHKEMKQWETSIPDDGCCSDDDNEVGIPGNRKQRARSFYEHSTSLHILAASLLLDWVSKSTAVSDPARRHVTPCSESWQVGRALQIMRCSRAKEDWSKCYLGSWPTLVIGYAVDSPEDVALIREDLEHRYQTLYCREELSFLAELEDVWQKKGILVR